MSAKCHQVARQRFGHELCCSSSHCLWNDFFPPHFPLLLWGQPQFREKRTKCFNTLMEPNNLLININGFEMDHQTTVSCFDCIFIWFLWFCTMLGFFFFCSLCWISVTQPSVCRLQHAFLLPQSFCVCNLLQVKMISSGASLCCFPASLRQSCGYIHAEAGQGISVMFSHGELMAWVLNFDAC